MFFVFLSTAVGILSAHRIFLYIWNQNVISKQRLTKIGTIYLIYVGFIVLFFNKNINSYFVLMFLPQVLIFLGIFILKRHRNKRFRTDFLIILEDLLFKMYVGHSFRHAFYETKQKINPIHLNIFNQIEEFVVYPQRKTLEIKDPFIREIINFFRKVDKSSHNCVERLEFYFQQQKKREDFRRRSKVITTQTRLQVIVLAVLYLSLFVFQCVSFGFYGFETVYLISIATYLFGIFVYFKIFKEQTQCMN